MGPVSRGHTTTQSTVLPTNTYPCGRGRWYSTAQGAQPKQHVLNYYATSKTQQPGRIGRSNHGPKSCTAATAPPPNKADKAR